MTSAQYALRGCARRYCALRSHGRIAVVAAERQQSISRAGDVEVEREVLVDGKDVAQVPLQRVVGIEALGAVARPQGLDRLARLVHGESRISAEAQFRLRIRDLVALRGGLERNGRLAQEEARRVDQAARAS